MRRSVILISAVLFLSPLAAQASDARQADVKYLGHGQFSYKDNRYSYNDLVQALRSAYSVVQMDRIVVDLGRVASANDKAQVCQLKQDFLGVPLKMKLTVEDGYQELFCN
jgi:hypothetical protein